MKTFSTSVFFTLPRQTAGLVDLSTTDERAWALAPQLVVSLIGRDFTVWVNPATGSSCRLETTGDYEVRRMVHHIPKPVVLGQVSPADALTMMAEPHSEATLRAVAHAIVAVEAAVT
jgi:hypothetical protein